MTLKTLHLLTLLWFTSLGTVILQFLLPSGLHAQEEVTSAVRRYKLHEQSTGYYEDYEVLPRRQRPLINIPGPRTGTLSYSSTAAAVRNR
mgnify:CR=1 FL=1